MILWKIETKKKIKKDQKSNQIANQETQFQDGTYEQVPVMLKLNKQVVHNELKEVQKKNKVSKGK